MSKWIEVSKHKPPVGCPVWTYASFIDEDLGIYEDICIAVFWGGQGWFVGNVEPPTYDDGKWQLDYQGPDDCYKPSHWMHLPLPPGKEARQ